MTTTYKVEVERDGKWWMINVPDIDQITQARRLSEVNDMARSLIAISTDTKFEDVAIHIVTIRMGSGHFRELLGLTDELRQRRTGIRILEEEVLRDSRQFAYYLSEDGVPVRDIAELLGVSPQRVSQLLHEDRRRSEPAPTKKPRPTKRAATVAKAPVAGKTTSVRTPAPKAPAKAAKKSRTRS